MQAKRYHIIIDLSGVDNLILNDTQALNGFLKALPGKIDMNILHGPTVIQGVPENPGITGFVVIDYSHISVHTFTQYNEALVDIFSCKPYDQEVAVQAALEYFKVDRSQAQIQVVSWP